MKNTNKIQSIFTTFLVLILLFVSTFSNVLTENNIIPVKSEKSTKKSTKENKTVINKTSIEAVFSQIVPSFTCESVVFQEAVFAFPSIEIVFKVISSFANKYHLEILLEHLIAPNAP